MRSARGSSVAILIEYGKYEKTEQKIHFLQKNEVSKLMALRVPDKEAE